MEISLYHDLPFPFTREWYADRHHAPHAEQPIHRVRMVSVAETVADLLNTDGYESVVDLGAGDGGMLQMIAEAVDGTKAHGSTYGWGYDLQPSNVEYAQHHRRRDVRFADFEKDKIVWGDIAVITECLEHLEDPHAMVRRIAEHAKAVVASSPSRETADSHDACHAWCWDMEGYRLMFEDAGITIHDHFEVNGDYAFQIIMGMS